MPLYVVFLFITLRRFTTIKLTLFAVLSGMFFAIWPLFMSRSGLSSYLAAAVFGACSLIVVTPFAMHDGVSTLQQAKWLPIFLAGLTGAAGMLIYTNILTTADLKDLGSLIIISTLSQMMIGALYESWQSGDISYQKLIGYVLAITSVFLLKK